MKGGLGVGDFFTRAVVVILMEKKRKLLYYDRFLSSNYEYNSFN